MALRILVTGTSRGLGRSIAEHFLEQGHAVVGCARSASTITAPAYSHVIADVSNEHAVDALLASIRRQHERLDVLINNAGWGRMAPVALTPAETARQILDMNFVSTFLVTRGAVRLLRSSAAPRIVNVTSVAVPLRLEGEAVYASAKSAIETFTRVVARELAAMRITCNAVGPSVARTRLTEGIPDDKLQRLLERQALPAFAEASDVINVIEFFMRPASALVTGQVVYLGGVG